MNLQKRHTIDKAAENYIVDRDNVEGALKFGLDHNLQLSVVLFSSSLHNKT